MEKARKKLRVCMICVVAAAVLIGIVYYFHDVKGNPEVSDGTLITVTGGVCPWL